MSLLRYLHAVATNADTRVNGNLQRSGLVAWVYGQTFVALVSGRPTLLRFQDCEAWAESPGAVQRRAVFFGDAADLAKRYVASDADLATVLRHDSKATGPIAYRVTVPDAVAEAINRVREALTDLSSDAALLHPSNAERVRGVLEAWDA